MKFILLGSASNSVLSLKVTFTVGFLLEPETKTSFCNCNPLVLCEGGIALKNNLAVLAIDEDK